VREEILQVPTPSGPMETFVTRPEADGRYPPVIFYMDIWGIRDELYDLARRAATVGYCAIVPDLYHRQGQVRFAFYDERGRMMTLEALSEERKAAVRAAGRQLSDAMVVEDTRALLAALGTFSGAKDGPVGCIGYCMGGRHAFRVAGAFADRVKASLCLHGSDLVTDRPDSPHLDAVKAQGELYCGYAEHDRFAAEPVRNAVEQAMRGSAAKFVPCLHKGAHHGYALPDRDVYDQPSANRDWETAFAMFRRQLG